MKATENIELKTTLADTIDGMTSDDYKERFKAEFTQVVIRHEKLVDMLNKWSNNQLDFIPACSRDVIIEQCYIMQDYIDILRSRAIVENIDLTNCVQWEDVTNA